MDIGTILVTQTQVQREMATAMSTGEASHIVQGMQQLDESGEYVLPVPFAPRQKEYLDAIISAHYSELLAYFSDEQNPDPNRAKRALESLTSMASWMRKICVHPELLSNDPFRHPFLTGREVPGKLIKDSGMLQALGQLVLVLSDLELDVGLVAEAGPTTDIIEAFLLDKPVNYYRYSGDHLKQPRAPLPRRSTIYLLPSKLEYLTAAVNSAFDLMIAVDDTFDLTTSYALGVRSQLRDPSVRKPKAPVVSLVPLNTIIHAQLSYDNQLDALAAAVVLSSQAGFIPDDVKAFYSNSMRPLTPWLQSPDKPWLLPRVVQIQRFGAQAVYEKLAETPDLQLLKEAAVSSNPVSKRVKLENGHASFTNDESFKEEFISKMIETLKDYKSAIVRQQKELDSLRGTATSRENALDDLRAEVRQLSLEKKERQNTRDNSDSKITRLRTDLEAVKGRELALKTKLRELEETLTSEDKESLKAKCAAAIKDAEEKSEEVTKLTSRLKSQESNLEYLKTELAQASRTILEVNNSTEALKKEIQDYKAKADGESLKAQELLIRSGIQEKDATIAQLRAELENYKAAMIVADQERAMTSRERSRFSNRVGGSRSKASTAVSSPAP